MSFGQSIFDLYVILLKYGDYFERELVLGGEVAIGVAFKEH